DTLRFPRTASDDAVLPGLQSPPLAPRIQRRGERRRCETGNHRGHDRHFSGVFGFGGHASPFRPDSRGGGPQQRPFGPALARRESGPLVLRLPPALAVVNGRDIQNFLKHSLPFACSVRQSITNIWALGAI